MGNETPTLEELLGRPYKVIVQEMPQEGCASYWMAYLPDIGASACSATGDTEEEARESLETVKREVFSYYLEKGYKIPEPSLG